MTIECLVLTHFVSYVGKVAASKGKELEGQVSFNFVVDISTEIIGDLAKQTFIDKKLLLTFYIARNTSSDDNPSSTPVATPKEGGGPSPNLNRNVFNADFKFGTVAIDLVDFLSQGPLFSSISLGLDSFGYKNSFCSAKFHSCEFFPLALFSSQSNRLAYFHAFAYFVLCLIETVMSFGSSHSRVSAIHNLMM